MNVVIFESCRSPEIIKGDTEGLNLSKYFKQQNIDYTLYSNDGIWPDKVVISSEIIQQRLVSPSTDIVHLAMHGSSDGLALSWSKDEYITNRKVIDLLTSKEISVMSEWKGKLIVSGACKSTHIADNFLAAGARGVISPSAEIPWNNLAKFFNKFYSSLKLEKNTTEALNNAINLYPEYKTFSYSK